MEQYIYWLKEIKQTDINEVGGKGANLGDMARGLTVPEGFCLSSSAYWQNLKHFGLDKKILALVKEVDINDIKTLEETAEAINDLIVDAPILPEIEQVVAEAFNRLAKNNREIEVAVRSSATAEDLEDASFAGQQETFLNVKGIENVLVSIKRCWASLWTARAIHYRTKKGFEHEKVRMAVLVQEMIPAAVSGVMFTANPVNNSRNEIRIEAVRGLGEKLVSGGSAGDVYVFKKNDTNVELVSKMVLDEDKGQLINDYDLRELAHIGLKIELFYGDFQDVEWAYFQGKFYFLQTRPITTLADEELPEINEEDLNAYQKNVISWVSERFPEPIFPIDGVIVKVLFMAQFEAMASYGFSIGEVDWSRVEKGIFPEFFVPPKITANFKRIWRYLNIRQTINSDPAFEWSQEQVYLLNILKKLKNRDISSLPFEIILEYITEALHHFHYFIVMRYNYFAQNGITSTILMKFLELAFKDEASGIYENLLAGSDNITLDINKALRDLAVYAKENPEVFEVIADAPLEKILPTLQESYGGRLFLERFNRFLELYGERETTMGLGGIASPTWQDQPQVVLGIIRGLIKEDPKAEALREETRRLKTKEAEEKVNYRLSKGILGMLNLNNFFYKVLKHARSFAAFRENSHYDVTRGIHVFRILFIELGKRFVKRGILNEPADIFYLSYYEIKEIIFTIYNGLEKLNTNAIKARIDLKKAEQNRRLERWKMRNVKFEESNSVKGVPASQGIATGAVRIIKAPQDFARLQKGDILIAPYTNPSWTPLFTTAAGLIVETGGAASHAAIIAREYGLPAVMGVVKATELFKEGELVTVNGSTGVIYRANL